MKTITKLWVYMAVLIILTPIGLIIPEHFKAGSAWGEWGAEEIQKLIGYVPRGFEKLSSLWNAPMPDYAFKGWEGKPLAKLSLAYIVSALVGIGLVGAIILLITKLLSGKNRCSK